MECDELKWSAWARDSEDHLCLNEDQDWLGLDDALVLSNSGAMTVCIYDILQDVMGTRFWISAQDRVD